MYWNDLPCQIVSAIARYKLAVWPVITSRASGRTNPIFSDLDSLIVASEADNQETLAALSLAGVNITQPPEYVKCLLTEAGVGFVLLTPLTARQTLLVSLHLVSCVLGLTPTVGKRISHVFAAF
jgi:sacsin